MNGFPWYYLFHANRYNKDMRDFDCAILHAYESLYICIIIMTNILLSKDRRMQIKYQGT